MMNTMFCIWSDCRKHSSKPKRLSSGANLLSRTIPSKKRPVLLYQPISFLLLALSVHLSPASQSLGIGDFRMLGTGSKANYFAFDPK
jgi:hypothetical protein